MVMKLSDIFKGNIMIVHEFNISLFDTHITIYSNGRYYTNDTDPIPLSLIFSRYTVISYATEIYHKSHPLCPYNVTKLKNGKTTIKYSCISCGGLTTYTDKNPKMMCKYCLSRGAVKW